MNNESDQVSIETSHSTRLATESIVFVELNVLSSTMLVLMLPEYIATTSGRWIVNINEWSTRERTYAFFLKRID